MSPAMKESKSWFAGNYDKLALILALVVLLLSALLLVLRTSAEKSSLSQIDTSGRFGKNSHVAEISLDNQQKRVDSVKNPYSSLNTRAENTNDMFVSEVRVISINTKDLPVPIPYDAMTCWATGDVQPELPTNRDSDVDGMLDVYEEEMGFDPLNADDAVADPDGDGFSNLEEYQAETNPKDGSEYPDLTAKLRLIAAKKNPFRLVFRSVSTLADGTVKFGLNDRETRQSYFAREGDDVIGYAITDYDPDFEEGPRIVLRKGEESYPLIKNKLLGEHEVVARMVFLLDGTSYTVKIDSEITLKSKTYKVIDIKPNAVSISDLGSGDVSRIGLITPDEKADLLEKLRQEKAASMPASVDGAVQGE